MLRRIFRSITLTAVIAVMLTTLLITSVMYSIYENRIWHDLRNETGYIAAALEMTENDVGYLESLDTSSRMTLIAADGSVVFDNLANVGDMDDHSGRPEIASAIETGSGESKRASGTISEVSVYCALRLDDGSIIRLSGTRSSMTGMFLDAAPLFVIMLLCISLFAFIIAKLCAKHIVAPINSVDLDKPMENEIYDELVPLLTRLEYQHIKIRRQMTALERAHSELAVIMENMREGMVLLDQQNCVLSMNESAARIFGVNSSSRVGQDLLYVTGNKDVGEIVHAAHEGRYSDVIIEKNGRDYRISASPVVSRRSINGVVLLALDVTERTAAEASRREFTANVSHELKTPLTSISGYAEIIRDGIALPADIPSFAGRILNESRRLLQLVNDILELSKLDEMHGFGEREEVSLRDVLSGLIDDFRPRAEEKHISLELDGPEMYIDGYPLLVQELFRNLIENSVKYTNDGGSVKVTLFSNAGHAACSVADTGIGIPEEHQAHIFERFYRVDKSHSRATGGTGLGLAIVKHAAGILGAKLDLESAENAGTTITVTF